MFMLSVVSLKPVAPVTINIENERVRRGRGPFGLVGGASVGAHSRAPVPLEGAVMRPSTRRLYCEA